jgi:hypothetical protein
VQELRGALEADLTDEEQLQVFSIVGRGGFGTVYHGALRPTPPSGGFPVATRPGARNTQPCWHADAALQCAAMRPFPQIQSHQ